MLLVSTHFNNGLTFLSIRFFFILLFSTINYYKRPDISNRCTYVLLSSQSIGLCSKNNSTEYLSMLWLQNHRPPVFSAQCLTSNSHLQLFHHIMFTPQKILGSDMVEFLRSALTTHHRPHYSVSDSRLIGNSAHLSYEWQVWKTGKSGQLVDELSVHWLNQRTSYLLQKYQTHIILRFSSTCSSHMGHNKSTELKIRLCTQKIKILRFCLVKAGTHALSISGIFFFFFLLFIWRILLYAMQM